MPLPKKERPFPRWIVWLLLVLALAIPGLMMWGRMEVSSTSASSSKPEVDAAREAVAVETPDSRPAAVKRRVHEAKAPDPRPSSPVPLPVVTVPVVSNTPVPSMQVVVASASNAESTVKVTVPAVVVPRLVSITEAGVTNCIVDLESPMEREKEREKLSVAAQERELITHSRMRIARITFTRKNDPAYANDKNLAEVVNAVACFYLHYPSRTECEELIVVCKMLEEARGPSDPLAAAIKGSRYIFESELDMMNRGYYRYGRVWVDASGMAKINAAITEREKNIEAELARQRQALPKADSVVKSVAPAVSPPRRMGLKGPDHPVKRLGSE